MSQLDNCNNQIPTQTKAQTEHISRPLGSKIVLCKNSEYIEIDIPSVGLFSWLTFLNLVVLAMFSGFALFIVVFKIDALAVSVFIVPIIGYIIETYLSISSSMKLTINHQKIFVKYILFGIQYYGLSSSPRRSICRLEKERLSNELYLKIWTDRQQYKIPTDRKFSISFSEINWLATELSEWLDLPVIEKYN